MMASGEVESASGSLQTGGWVYIDYTLIAVMVAVTFYVLFWL